MNEDQRCFRCTKLKQVGHQFKEEDRIDICFKCENGHKLKHHNNDPLCVLCAETRLSKEGTRHVTGSRNCEAFCRVLKEEKQKLNS